MVNYYLHVHPKYKKDDFSMSFNDNNYDIIVSKDDLSFVKENIIPNLEIVLLNYNTLLSKKMVSPRNLTKYINLLYTYSPEFISKMSSEMKTLTSSQLELFFEYVKFNQNISKKFNPLFDVLRIKNGVLTNKVFFTEFASVCNHTYPGFLRAIKDKTVKFIKAKVNGKETLLLVKDHAGYLDSKKHGTNILALDPKTFNVYKISSSIKNNRLVHDVVKAKSSIAEHFIDFKTAKQFNKEKKYYLSFIDVVDVVNNIKLALKNYSLKKTTKRNEKFKAAAKKMLADKETKKIIKNRFRK